MPEVRYLRRDQRMQLTGAKALSHFGTGYRQAAVSCAGAAAHDVRTKKSDDKQFAPIFVARTDLRCSARCASISIVPLFSDARHRVIRLRGSIFSMIEIVVKNLAISYASR